MGWGGERMVWAGRKELLGVGETVNMIPREIFPVRKRGRLTCGGGGGGGGRWRGGGGQVLVGLIDCRWCR